MWDQSFRILEPNYRKLLEMTLFISPNIILEVEKNHILEKNILGTLEMLKDRTE